MSLMTLQVSRLRTCHIQMMWGRLATLMPLVFPMTGRSAKLWGGPPVRGRPSRLDEIDPVAKSGSRGTRADQGVRPTIFAEFSQLEKRVALGREEAKHCMV